MVENLKFRDYVFMIFITTMPFLLLLLSLKFFANENFILNNTIYWILIGFLLIIFILSFIISLLYAFDHILNEQKGILKKLIHFTLLVLFNAIYLPFYYSIYMVNEKLLGLFMPIVNIGTIILFSFASYNYLLNYFEKLDEKNIVVATNLKYLSKNDLFTINVTKDYVCNKELGDYVVSCDNNFDDSFLGIYSYNHNEYTPAQLDDIYNFHLEQTKEYINEAGYEYEEIIVEELVILKYDNMNVLYMGIDYDIDNDGIDDYRLIIIKEVLDYENVVSDFNELINSIEFIGNN